MDNNYNSPMQDTPVTSFNKENNLFEIKGNSYLENCADFYEPIKSFIDNYANSGKDSLNLTFFFNLINSTSTVYVAQIIARAALLKNKGITINITWMYDEDDEELMELGEKLSKISNLEFNYKSVKS